jgi:putative glutamine amidotransferase
MKIGITDCGEKYPIYERWILSQQNFGNKIETIILGYKYNNLHEIEQCDGIVLTGGEDIHPRFYNRLDYLELCNPDFMDERRDEFEWKVCEYIFENQLPVLGICRGLQLVNVFLGGTLIPDIPTAGKENHSKFYEGKDRYHAVEILHDSELSKITNIVFGDVNSAHHQSADIIAKSLKVNALSDDKIVEGLEFDYGVLDSARTPVFDSARTPVFDSARTPVFDSASDSSPERSRGQRSRGQRSRGQQSREHYLMLVQWHPERIINAEQNNFSYKIRQDFVENIQLKIQ